MMDATTHWAPWIGLIFQHLHGHVFFGFSTMGRVRLPQGQPSQSNPLPKPKNIRSFHEGDMNSPLFRDDAFWRPHFLVFLEGGMVLWWDEWWKDLHKKSEVQNGAGQIAPIMCDLARKAQVHNKSTILQSSIKMGWTLLTSRIISGSFCLRYFHKRRNDSSSREPLLYGFVVGMGIQCIPSTGFPVK